MSSGYAMAALLLNHYQRVSVNDMNNIKPINMSAGVDEELTGSPSKLWTS